jgi:hypothetical protein
MLSRFSADVVSALRALTRTRGVAAVAVLTLAVAAGANLAMVGLVDRALLSPPPHIGISTTAGSHG